MNYRISATFSEDPQYNNTSKEKSKKLLKVFYKSEMFTKKSMFCSFPT